MVSQKPDSSQIRNFLEALAKQDWVQRSERRWGPGFVFHYTDLLNAVGILQDGHLYSRKYVEERGKLRVSSGSTDVLASTDTSIKECVRLYFRPQTPTQFHVEGIQSQNTLSRSRYSDAHCPVMIFFLFDSVQILTRADCQFSDGNLGTKGTRRLSTATELENLPWQKIYHVGPFDRSRYEESDIVFRRNAEVIVPDKLDLSALRYIFCRSEAEKDTLMHLLPRELRRRYQRKIVATTSSTLFFRRHTFVETALLSAETAHFYFSPDTKSPGPFHLIVELNNGLRQLRTERTEFLVNPKEPFGGKFPRPIESYTISLSLDGHLAYASSYQTRKMPY